MGAVVQIEGTEVEWTLGFALTEECRMSRQHAPVSDPSTSTSTEPTSRCHDKGMCDSQAENIGTTRAGEAAADTCDNVSSAAGLRLRAASQALLGLRSSISSVVRKMVVVPTQKILEQVVLLWRVFTSSVMSAGRRVYRAWPKLPRWTSRIPSHGGTDNMEREDAKEVNEGIVP